jgi:glycosyltransferase involved in cell wall biosynthesis
VLHAEHGVPFVLDDRDSWILDVYTGEQLANADAVRPWLDLALDGATQMWFVNPPIADWHRAAYPEHAGKIRVVENGWDHRFLAPEEFASQPQDPEHLVFAFVGTLNSKLPLRLIAEAWREARRRSDAVARAQLRMVGHFGHGGVMTPAQAQLRDEFGPEGMIFTGRQPKQQIARTYGDADVLVFAKEGSGLVTSGKVYEYVATGRPIVSMIEREHDARRVLEGYPRWHDAVSDDVGAIADAFVAAAADALDGSARRPAALAHGARFRRDALLGRALDELDRVLTP